MSKSKADQARLDQIHNMPCICCQIEKRMQPFRTEAHHITDKGYRRLSGGDQASLPLCSFHHRGQLLNNCSTSRMVELYGPSLALSKKAFIAKYGTERELLSKVNELLGEPNEQR